MRRPKGPLESAEASVGLSLLEEAEGRSHTDYHLSIWTWTKKNVFCFLIKDHLHGTRAHGTRTEPHVGLSGEIKILRVGP